MMAIVYWEMNGKTGHGEPFPVEYAAAWVKQLNEWYGAGTHWMVLCND